MTLHIDPEKEDAKKHHECTAREYEAHNDMACIYTDDLEYMDTWVQPQYASR